MIGPMRIGPYEVVSTLGQGGMGVVYAARSTEGRSVAVKVLRKNEGEVVARFERERRLLASFGEAEGFVPLLDAGTTPEGPYLVMPLVPGGTLRKKLEAGPLGIEETVELGRSLAAALGAAHARGVVHRDMKPENVLLTAQGLPLIADLGLAKHFDLGAPGASQTVSLSRRGGLRGTAGYMAREQMADAKIVGPTADVFSLGVILYECLAGEPPFLGESFFEVLAKVSAGSVEPLRGRRPDMPAWLAAVVERALAPAAWDRFPDGLALGRALEAGGAKAPGGRLPAGVLVGTGVVLLAGALGLGHAVMARQPDAPKTEAPAPAGRPPAPSDDARARAEETAKSGDVRFAKGDHDRAITHDDRAIELDRKNASDWNNRGLAKASKGDWDAAIADYTRAIELDPERAMTWGNRGIAKENKGDSDGAIADLSRAIELAPTVSRAWCGRGFARANKGDQDGAIADFTRAIELDPKLAAAWGNRGFAKESKGDDDGAIADYTRVIEFDPEYVMAWRNRGSAKSKKGDYGGAIADCERFLELAPNDSQAPAVRAEIERLKGLRDKANDGAGDARERAEEAFKSGRERSVKGDFDGAIADYSRAIELDPRYALAWGSRGAARAKKEDWDGAIADYTRAIELDPTLASAWGCRGFAKASKRDWDGTIADLDRAIELDPKETSDWGNRGFAKASKGDYGGAIADYTRAIELAPTLAPAWGNRGYAKAYKGDVDGAIADMERCLELAPNDAQVPAVRAEVARLKGLRDKR
jgi:tetratricopeptide (TPR) repeat protein